EKRSFKLNEVIAWSMIDFSNSLAMVVVLALYAAFIPAYVFEEKAEGTKWLKYNSIATGVFSIVSTPILGAVIDICGYKLRTLAISGFLYSLSTMALTNVGYGDTGYVMFFYALVDITFRINESVCSSLLPTIAKERDYGFVSGAGYFIGYIAGFAVIQIVNRLTPTTATDPLDPNWDTVFTERGSAMLITGIFMILSLLPSLLVLNDDKNKNRLTSGVIKTAFKSNASTFTKAFSENRSLTMVLVSYLLFMCGMYTQRAYNAFLHIRWAKSYGVDLHLVQTVMSVINIVVGCMSLLYGYISKFVGVKPMILVSIFFVALCSTVSIVWEPLGEALGVNPVMQVLGLDCCT
ncbi:major facilitator superfamily protein, partial [Kipferlia bialata]